MGQLGYILKQSGRNIKHTWSTQLMTLFTVSLSVLIFSFFFLVYTNMVKAGAKLDDDLRLVIYLEDEVVPEMQNQLKQKITEYSEVEKIVFISRQEAFKRLSEQLGNDRDVLNDLGPSFLPPSVEVYPQKKLKSLTRIKEFSDYLATLPGASKVQYGHNWMERFGYFTKLLRIIVMLSGALLLLTTVFIVSYTIRLTVVARHEEIELLRLLGANNAYIQGPLFIEGLLQGFLGTITGIISLYLLYQWIKSRFSGPGILQLFEFTFFPPAVTALILATGLILCCGGSLLSIRKYLRI